MDFPCVTYVVHFGPSGDLVSHLQEAGRAGGDGKSQAHNVIVYLGKHKALCDNDMKTVLKSKECVRKLSTFIVVQRVLGLNNQISPFAAYPGIIIPYLPSHSLSFLGIC